MSSQAPSSPQLSGIRESKTGERVIPATRRPDGTVRKERKVRPGFVPQEDVTRYSNARVEATKVPEGYVPGLPTQNTTPNSASVDVSASKSAKKNAKRKVKKAAEADPEDLSLSTVTPSTKPATASLPATNIATPPASSSAAEPEKRLKALRKKLRQIEDLETKQASATIPLIPEQLEKISTKPAIESEITELEKAVAALSL
ncbi:hypothetical protein PhCBS80983_g02590 [Powellomyces hirtus]|uniref:WIBG Mago-binding domain-containing protein n=1 Tax=Powellomyces hirtus TaxID=109895 RepID=A0A507E5Y0_9FUNG|nr:hypothetical protein DFJ77DRAFT_478660 [Powellomyces hirtus]TPX59282.1 hypothetical protein PhCBS80983_g02590 [Powellomyces hirtus]